MRQLYEIANLISETYILVNKSIEIRICCITIEGKSLWRRGYTTVKKVFFEARLYLYVIT